ncbi:MAG: hypothetical protein Q7S21_02680 [archaeon]|nr:hypothetical protein [archaeon]
MPNPYTQAALSKIPHLLSLIDKNPFSQTFGCVDRKYWRYKTRDYVNARLHESALALAIIFSQKFEGNEYYKNDEIKKLCIAGMQYWSKIQHSSGYFDEYYPNENSQPTTAFSALCVAKAYLLLELNDETIKNSLIKVGNYLEKSFDWQVANHDAGACAYLYLIYKISGEKKFLELSNKRLEQLLSMQNEEGWFPEYGKADIGYLSFTLYYLNELFELSKDKKVLESMKKAIKFYSYFIHPDYSIGGMYASRETTFILPTAFEKTIGLIEESAGISFALRKAIEEQKIISPIGFDDRYTADALYPFLQCFELKTIGKEELKKLPAFNSADFFRNFSNTGIVINKKNNFYSIINVTKGGIGKHFFKNSLVLNDTGWVTKIDGKILTTNGASEAIVNENKIEISGNFFAVKQELLDTKKLIALRTLSKLGLSGLIKQMLREKLILNNKETNLAFKRTIDFKNKQIEINDEFSGINTAQLELSSNFSRIYTTSLGLFEEINELRQIKLSKQENRAKIYINEL